MDKERFDDLCREIVGAQRQIYGIGTLCEKTLHLILKHYIEPDTNFHEVKVGRRYADVKIGDRIFEIQTRAFDRLRPKLKSFLADNKVTVVFPIAKYKTICWVDPETGDTTAPRKSPKQGSPIDILSELYKIKMHLNDPNLSFKIIMLSIDEFRLRNGWSRDKKRGSTKYESIPTEIIEEIDISGMSDYVKLLPDALPEQFGVKELARLSKRTEYRARTALNVLSYVGAVVRIHSDTRAYRYVINKDYL